MKRKSLKINRTKQDRHGILLIELLLCKVYKCLRIRYIMFSTLYPIGIRTSSSYFMMCGEHTLFIPNHIQLNSS
ncbi:hypothetical protein C0J52_00954 [Blattella germanica]|nr:hypothetical protein C0J52_00954 [Blattella germanica]